MPISREDALREANRRGLLPPRQKAAFEEAMRRGLLSKDTSQTSEPPATIRPQTQEPVLPSSLNQNDFDRLQRTGLTPGTAVDFAGISIATENARRREEGIPALSPQQAEARLRLFKQGAGTPGSETRDHFAEIQKFQREQRDSTLAGRFNNAALAGLQRIGDAGLSITGVIAPETANTLSDAFNKVLNPNVESLSGQAGGVAGEAVKTLSFAQAGPVSLAGLFAAQGAGGTRQEAAELRKKGANIGLIRELTTAAKVGGVEAVSGVITEAIFSNLGRIASTATPALRAAIARGEQTAIGEWVRQGLSIFGNLIVEGGEEGVTQLITNNIKRKGINPGQAVTEGVLESVITGALLAPLGGGATKTQTQTQTETDSSVSESPTGETLLTKLQQRRQAAKEANLADTITKAAPQGDTEQAAADVQTSKDKADARNAQTENGLVDQSDDAAIERLLGRDTKPELAEQTDLNTNTSTDTQDAIEQQIGDISASETPIQSINRVASRRSPDGTTSARTVDVRAHPEALNSLLSDKTDIRTWQEALSAAQELDVPNRAVEIAQGVLLDPSPMSDIKTAGVLVRTISTIKEHDTLSTKLEQTTSQTEKDLLSAELVRLEETHDILIRSLRKSGSEAGRALNIQKLVLNRNFELGTVLERARSVKQKALNPRQQVRLTTLTQQVSELKAEIAHLQDQPESESPTLNQARKTAIENLQFKQNLVQSKINRVIQNLQPRSLLETVVSEPLGLMRAIRASYDVSAVGRQAGLAALGNPVLAIKNLRPMFKALMSEENQFKINQQVKARNNFDFYRRIGLRIIDTDLGAQLVDKEEAYRSRYAEFIPGIRASDRAFSTYLNLMRADSADALIATLARNEKPTLDEGKAIAQLVNNFTGFGGLASQKASAELLTTVFWSPSLQLSRMQVLTGAAIRKGHAASPRVRNLIIQEYAKTLFGFATLLTLGTLTGYQLETDATSSDFLKLRQGDTRIDLGSGLMQYVVLVNKIAQGQSKSAITKKITKLRGKDKVFFRSVGGEVGRFLRAKLTPGLGLGVDIALFDFKNVVGQDIRQPISSLAAGADAIGANTGVETIDGAKNIILNNISPLAIDEVFQSLRAKGVPKGTALGLLSIFGEGVQTFGKKKKI